MRRLRMASLAVTVLAATALVASSCGGFRAELSVLRGNRLFASGLHGDAQAAYMAAGERGSDDELKAIALYDLGNVFAALGEGASAKPLFEAAAQAESPLVRASALHNLGVALYAREDYAEAAAAFRASLAAMPRGAERRDTSRAYELALEASRKRRLQGAVERAGFADAAVQGGESRFSLSRVDERALFAPGDSSGGSGVDK